MNSNFLRKIKKKLDEFVANFSRINYVLWNVERSEEYKEFRIIIYEALMKQTIIFLRTDIFKSLEEIFKKIDLDLLDKSEIEREINKNFNPLNISKEKLGIKLRFFADKGGQAFLNKMGADALFSLTNDVYIGKLYKKVDLLIENLDNTTKNWLKNRIIEGYEEGLSSREIANFIRTKIPETYNYRSEVIARTEMSNVVNETEFEAAKNNNVDTKKWVAAGLNICEICEENDGIEIALNDTFPSGDIRPPSHVNCKCLLEYNYSVPELTPKKFWEGE